MKLSVVVTLFNEEDNVKPLLANVASALKEFNYELILVDDGSTDATVARIKEIAGPRVKLIRLFRNYGQTAAMAAGIDSSEGDYIITMDGDLQNDPTDIPVMLDKLIKEGWDVVAGRRKNRQDNSIRKIFSRTANRMIRNMTNVHVHDYGCTLKVFTSELAKRLNLYGELHRFIPILAVMQGGKITEMDVKHHPRVHGQSKYTLNRTFRVLSDLILVIFFQKYFRRPIHFFGPIGIVTLVAGMLIDAYLLVEKILGKDIWGRPLLILGVTLLIGGIQFLTFGLLAELMMRIYYESQNKKTYSIKEIFIGREDQEQRLEMVN